MISIADINSLMGALSAAGQQILNDAVVFLPGFLAALIVFVLGWVIAIIVSRLFRSLLRLIRLEESLKAHKVEDALGSVKISDVLAKIVKYYILLIFIQAAVSLVSLGTISDFLSEVLVYVPVLIAAALIVLIAVILGEYVKEMLIELSKSPLVKLAARGAKLVIIYVGVTMGLSRVGFETTLLDGSFLTILQAVAFGIALAFGIAFGFGGQDDARDIIKSGRRQFKL
ncbi:MAG: hypothetical protein V1827_04670 [Candidatus Micrarchaeota archaeon]